MNQTSWPVHRSRYDVLQYYYYYYEIRTINRFYCINYLSYLWINRMYKGVWSFIELWNRSFSWLYSFPRIRYFDFIYFY